MLRYLTLTAVAASALSFSAPAFAAGTTAADTATCSKSDASKFKSKDELIALLTAQNLTVKQIKTEKGCYEAYTVDAAGKKATLGFNAETLDPVANAEAGEN